MKQQMEKYPCGVTFYKKDWSVSIFGATARFMSRASSLQVSAQTKRCGRSVTRFTRDNQCGFSCQGGEYNKMYEEEYTWVVGT